MEIRRKQREQFVYTGCKSDYDVKWLKIMETAPDFKPLMKNKKFVFVIVTSYNRFTFETNNFNELVEMAKSKTAPIGRTYAVDQVQIYWLDENHKEYLICNITHNLKRYYEPISRFDHSIK